MVVPSVRHIGIALTRGARIRAGRGARTVVHRIEMCPAADLPAPDLRDYAGTRRAARTRWCTQFLRRTARARRDSMTARPAMSWPTGVDIGVLQRISPRHRRGP